VGDSYSSGEGIRGIYFDPRDPRHQSRVSAAAQAAANLQAARAAGGASSGATTSDVFLTQRIDVPRGQRPQDPLDQSTWHDPDDLAALALRNDSFSDETYQAQANHNPKGYAPTLIARLLAGAADDVRRRAERQPVRFRPRPGTNLRSARLRSPCPPSADAVTQAPPPPPPPPPGSFAGV